MYQSLANGTQELAKQIDCLTSSRRGSGEQIYDAPLNHTGLFSSNLLLVSADRRSRSSWSYKITPKNHKADFMPFGSVTVPATDSDSGKLPVIVKIKFHFSSAINGLT